KEKTTVHRWVAKQKTGTIRKRKVSLQQSFVESNIGIEININGNAISLPAQFIQIATEIERSKYILNLKENWDEDGASKISEAVWLRSISFLLKYSLFIYKNFGPVIVQPEINPCRNGSIDLSWKTSKARLLVNITEEENNKAFYYGDLYNEENPIKGFVSIDEVGEHLATWMKNLT
ncbi:MAG: hypothetical protein JO149_07845, partial [Gammaproteobacteria bacterium]|nr:hypothetical protein [Gammaproteobacteria bacterium]